MQAHEAARAQGPAQPRQEHRALADPRAALRHRARRQEDQRLRQLHPRSGGARAPRRADGRRGDTLGLLDARLQVARADDRPLRAHHHLPPPQVAAGAGRRWHRVGELGGRQADALRRRAAREGADAEGCRAPWAAARDAQPRGARVALLPGYLRRALGAAVHQVHRERRRGKQAAARPHAAERLGPASPAPRPLIPECALLASLGRAPLSRLGVSFARSSRT